MKNKNYYLSVLVAFFLITPSQNYAQNWFPLEVGNEWQYLYSFSSFSPDGSFTEFSLDRFSILNDTLINQTYYYKWSRYPSIWIRFDENAQTLNMRCENEDKVIMDFNIGVGIDTLLTPYNCYNDLVTIIEKNISFGDSTIYGKGFFRSQGFYYPLKFRDYYSKNLGFTKNRMFQDSPGGGASSWQLSLIQAKIGSNVYSHNYYPEIIIQPITVVEDSIFHLTFEVNHPYNNIFPDSIPSISLNFIDTVYFHSFYSKNGTIINNPDLFAESISGTSEWDINAFINMNLMMNDYKFNYRIEAVDKSLIPRRSFAPDTGYFVAVYDTVTDVRDNYKTISDFELHQNYPNPFNPSTSVQYAISSRQFVTIKVYDILGKEVATLVNEVKPAGEYKVEFNAVNLPSGIYFYRIQAGSYINTKKMILLR